MQTAIYYLAPIMGVVGLIAAALIFRGLMRLDPGEGPIVRIAEQIHQGAMLFMRREIWLIGLFAILVGMLLLFKDPWESLAFFMGAGASSIAGFIGMFAATKANVRTTVAAHKQGANHALRVAFFGGSIMGLTVACADSCPPSTPSPVGKFGTSPSPDPSIGR